MKRALHLVSNAHLDPVWQWEWEEGAAAAISTFRCAASFCREFDGYIFCHNESLLYRWIEEYEPSLFNEIKQLVAEGKWHIMGGWHDQPDCNMPSGEAFTRQVLEGRKYFLEKFGVAPRTAINFDPFGHTRGLVQILAKSGYDSYLFCRPSCNECPLPSEDFTWVGYDGSKVSAHRSQSGYGTGLGHAVDKMHGETACLSDQRPIWMCLWGVGDHGGGASREDLRKIEEYQKACEKDGIEVIHSTPENYFDKLRESGAILPEHKGDLNQWAPGCYTSQVRVKQKYRETENMLFSCEKMLSQLACDKDFTYPERELGEALYDMLTVQFHDALPGSSVQAVEEMAMRMLDHALEILSRLRFKAFIMLARGQKEAAEGEIPILCYNPHPYPAEGDYSCEFMLSDQNWTDTFTIPTVYSDRKKLPSQCEKEASNIPLDWRKRVVFHATLPPMSVCRFDCKLERIAKKPVPSLGGDDTHFIFTSPYMTVKINRTTGLIDSVNVAGDEYIRPGAFTLDVIRDNADPWGMTVNGWREKLGEFTLLSDAEATAFSDVESEIPAIRAIEDGEVRTVVEAVFGYGYSRAVVRYILSKTRAAIELEIRLINNEKSKMIRLNVPQNLTDARPALEVAFGEEPMRTDENECVGQKYMKIHSEQTGKTLCIYNRGIYGSSYNDKNGDVRLTLLRSAGYTTHPIGDRKSLPQDRYSAHIDQGERVYPICLTFGDNENIARTAQIYNEVPTVFSFFPSGDEAPAYLSPVVLDGDGIVMTALKKAETRNCLVVRLFNPQDKPADVTLSSPVFGLKEKISFTPFEVKTFFLSGEGLRECNLIEDIIG